MHKADSSFWTYVDLHDLDRDPRPYYVKYSLMFGYRRWLEEHVGPWAKSWQHCTSAPCAYALGIYFKEPQDATVFKLKFGL